MNNINIVKYRTYDQSTLIRRLRKVTLENNPEVWIYEKAKIQITEVNPNDLYPAQYYVLKGELAKVTSIRSAFLKKGIDIMALDGYVKFWTKINKGIPVDILPPIVEESIGRDGEKVPLICDGIHRIYAADKLRVRVKVVFIEDVPQEYPYYAYPNKNKWDDVIELDSLPPRYTKKDYRVKEHRKLFRDFNSAFDNVGRRRKYGVKFNSKVML